MKRVIMTAPESLEWDDLTNEQQAAITGVLGQWVMPMPGTVAHDGRKIIDALTTDAFDPANIQLLKLPFVVLGILQYDGEITTNIHPLDEAFYAYLENPENPHIPHAWSGWPA